MSRSVICGGNFTVLYNLITHTTDRCNNKLRHKIHSSCVVYCYYHTIYGIITQSVCEWGGQMQSILPVLLTFLLAGVVVAILWKDWVKVLMKKDWL